MIDLDTPAVLIDLKIVRANIARAQAVARDQHVDLRPHIKTHKLPRLAQMQLSAGAVGICCQKVSEAAAMADGGLDDILISYNIVGAHKLAALKDLHARVTLRVAADHPSVVAGYGAAFTDPDRPLGVLIECDTGAARCGVQTAADAVSLARQIDGARGLRFDGLMTYPPLADTSGANAWLARAIDELSGAGLAPGIVSFGGSPNLMDPDIGRHATEHRPGTYIYNDRMQVALGWATLEDCALSVLATVVSRPTDTRAVLDSGSKTLAADQAPKDTPGYGHIPDYPNAVISALYEEHAVVDLSACAEKPAIGDRIRVIPNHACVVSNLFDTVHLIEEDGSLTATPVAARGLLT